MYWHKLAYSKVRFIYKFYKLTLFLPSLVGASEFDSVPTRTYLVLILTIGAQCTISIWVYVRYLSDPSWLLVNFATTEERPLLSPVSHQAVLKVRRTNWRSLAYSKNKHYCQARRTNGVRPCAKSLGYQKLQSDCSWQFWRNNVESVGLPAAPTWLHWLEKQNLKVLSSACCSPPTELVRSQLSGDDKMPNNRNQNPIECLQLWRGKPSFQTRRSRHRYASVISVESVASSTSIWLLF